MKKYCSEIKDNLPVIVLMSHGSLAQSLLESARLITGRIDNISYLCLEEGDNPQEFKKEVKELLNELPQRKIVLVDLFGGTPCNAFISVFNDIKSKTNAISGMNLPMLLEVINCRANMTNLQIANYTETMGKESICNINERILGIKE